MIAFCKTQNTWTFWNETVAVIENQSVCIRMHYTKISQQFKYLYVIQTFIFKGLVVVVVVVVVVVAAAAVVVVNVEIVT
jgi:hypothetical protein